MGCHNGQVCVRVCPKARLEKPRVRQTRFDFKKAPGNLCVGLRKSSVPSVVRSSSAAAFFTSQWYVRQTRVQFQHSPYSQATITVRLAIHKAPAYILITSTRHRVLSDITKKYYCWQTHAIKLWTKAQEIRVCDFRLDDVLCGEPFDINTSRSRPSGRSKNRLPYGCCTRQSDSRAA